MVYYIIDKKERKETDMQPCYLYDTMPKTDTRRNVCVVDTEALKHNYSLLVSMSEKSRPIAVVKADAYGHTAEICVPALLSQGCDFFAVSCTEEATSVRNLCRREGAEADVLILGYTDPKDVPFLSKNNIIQTAVSLAHAEKLSRVAIEKNCVLRVHVAADTGMNRIGVCATEDSLCASAADEIEKITRLKGLSVEGIFTHFSKSDGEAVETLSCDSFTRAQAARFAKITQMLKDRGIKLFTHACNSAATLRFPEYHLDGVRLGIALYGVYPSEHFEDIGLLPVMSLSSVIAHIHTAPKGSCVGYGGAYTASEDTVIATLPIGYADGFVRRYSGADVTVSSDEGLRRAKIVGRICMDQCMIDVTGINVNVGDRVVLFGDTPDSLRSLAALADTIEYECLCLISARVPRVKK